MSDLQKITTKTGTTYVRHKRPLNYSEKVFARLSTEDKTMFELLVKKENITTAEKLRELIKNYIKENI